MAAFARLGAGGLNAVDELTAFLATLPGRAAHRPVLAREPISVSVIRTWCDAMGERSPSGARSDGHAVAPPATLQMWTFPGLAPGRPVDAGPAAPGDLDHEVRGELARHGFTAALATGTDQEFVADLRPGDLVLARDRYTAVSSLKQTSLGLGYFLSSRTTYSTQDGRVAGHVLLTVFHFRPRPAGALPDPFPRPPRTPLLRGPAAPVPMRAGQALGPLHLPITPTLIVAGALATQDPHPVHHDRDYARAHGSRDIVMNIMTTNGLLARVVGEWTGGASLTRLATRLRSSAHPHQTLTLDGSVVGVGCGRAGLAVRAVTAAGVHAEATAVVRVATGV